MSKIHLRAVSRTQGNNAAVKSGSIELPHFKLDFEEVPVLVHAFRNMVRELRYDVCEMALTTYLCAREHGVEFTAIPVFLVRGFHHGAILYKPGMGVSSPTDLEGRRVGVNRGYTVTTGVWARAILQEEYGVDLNSITWILSGDEHVEAYRPPANVEPIADGTTIEEQLDAGELAAAVNITTENPAIKPLIDAPLEAGLRALKQRGHYPINHLIVVRNDVLKRHPTLGAELFAAFTQSKRAYVEALRHGKIVDTDSNDRLYLRMLDIGYDPLPYGIEPNRHILSKLIEHARAQKIIAKPVDINSLFAEGTHSLSG